MARTLTAMIEFKVVRGIWPRPASSAPVRKEDQVGMNMEGCQRCKKGRLCVPVEDTERMRPRMKMRRA